MYMRIRSTWTVILPATMFQKNEEISPSSVCDLQTSMSKVILYTSRGEMILKFKYSEKATKIWKNLNMESHTSCNNVSKKWWNFPFKCMWLAIKHEQSHFIYVAWWDDFKVQIFWEGNENLKKISNFTWHYSVALKMFRAD